MHHIKSCVSKQAFGIIKSVQCFRQFSLRSLKKVTGEWTLACLAWSLKRMAVLRSSRLRRKDGGGRTSSLKMQV